MKTFIEKIKKDLYRWDKQTDVLTFIKRFIASPGYNYLVWFRLCQYFNSTNKKVLTFIVKRILKHQSIKYGINISYLAQIGDGLIIAHWGNIVITGGAVIGNNCNIYQGVNIGEKLRGERKGYPTIGDKVFISPGAKVIGKIKIGNNVVIGANAVVDKDIDNNAVVVGIPGKIISYQGIEGYIENVIDGF